MEDHAGLPLLVGMETWKQMRSVMTGTKFLMMAATRNATQKNLNELCIVQKVLKIALFSNVFKSNSSRKSYFLFLV